MTRKSTKLLGGFCFFTIAAVLTWCGGNVLNIWIRIGYPLGLGAMGYLLSGGAK